MKTGTRALWERPFATKIFKTACASMTSSCVFLPLPEKAKEIIPEMPELLAAYASQAADRLYRLSDEARQDAEDAEDDYWEMMQ